jgi:hypothetical protein
MHEYLQEKTYKYRSIASKGIVQFLFRANNINILRMKCHLKNVVSYFYLVMLIGSWW